MRASERPHVYSIGCYTHARLRVCIVLIATQSFRMVSFHTVLWQLSVQKNVVTCILCVRRCDRG